MRFAILIAVLLLVPAASAWAGQARPIDRLGSQPPLSSGQRSPALEARDAAERQRLKGEIRRLEHQNRPGGGLTPTERRQKAIQRGPGRRAGEIQERKRDLNEIKRLEID